MRPLILALLASVIAGQACVATASAPEPVRANGSTRDAGVPAATLVPDDAYRVGPEDVIEVFVWKEPELSTEVTVRPDGRVTLPLAGEVLAAGRTSTELQQEIANSLSRFLEQPTVTVIVKTVNSSQISVLGEVQRPGRYRIAQHATILDAIALGGGFTEFARRNSVVVLRRTSYGVRKIRVDVRRMLRNGNKPLVLESGDTVYVE
jgi:polysaccharide export outer membrane protein